MHFLVQIQQYLTAKKTFVKVVVEVIPKQIPVKLSQSSSGLKLSHLPRQVTKVRVYGAADNLATNTAELLCPVAESHNLSGADKCEVQRVEEQDHILPCRAEEDKVTDTNIRYTVKAVVTQDDIVNIK